MAEFKPGDVVTLKSGGPPMTITHVERNDAWCEWFNRTDSAYEHKTAIVKLVALARVE